MAGGVDLPLFMIHFGLTVGIVETYRGSTKPDAKPECHSVLRIDRRDGYIIYCALYKFKTILSRVIGTDAHRPFME
jgi:hypothetical protein